VMIW